MKGSAQLGFLANIQQNFTVSHGGTQVFALLYLCDRANHSIASLALQKGITAIQSALGRNSFHHSPKTLHGTFST